MGVIENPLEFNSSRVFVAQQVQKLYKADYEQLFGTFPDISKFPSVDAANAGCSTLPKDPNARCDKEFDDAVTEIIVNMGKAINAYMRDLSCGPSRFDDWVHGDQTALTAEEIRGAELFVGKANCVSCHSGPYFSDQKFYNVGLPPASVALFLYLANDPGASVGFSQMLSDPLNIKGKFSDGDDGRIDFLASQSSTESYLGKFRTPMLRCLSLRPSYMHTGQLRSLEDVVQFFNEGGGEAGSFLGIKDIKPLGLSDNEVTDIVAFLRALDGPGPDASLISPPNLPQTP